MKRETMYEFKVRRQRRTFAHEGGISGPLDAARFLRKLTDDDHREHFFVIFLDAAGRVVGYHEVAIGIATAVEVHPREFFLPAITAGAVSVIAAHNHPSGTATPSIDDLRLTGRLVAAGHLLGIPVIDHVILPAGRDIVSIRETDPQLFVKG